MINVSAADFTIRKYVNDEGYYEGYELEGVFEGDYYSTAKELLPETSCVDSVCYVDLNSGKAYVLYRNKELQFSQYRITLKDYAVVSTGSGLLVRVDIALRDLPDLLKMSHFKDVISYLKALPIQTLTIISSEATDDDLPF